MCLSPKFSPPVLLYELWIKTIRYTSTRTPTTIAQSATLKTAKFENLEDPQHIHILTYLRDFHGPSENHSRNNAVYFCFEWVLNQYKYN